MGTRFDIKPARVREAHYEIDSYSKSVEQVGYEVLEISKRLRGMSGMDKVCIALRHISEDAHMEAASLAKVSAAAAQISALYDRTEDNITINGEKCRQRFAMHTVVAFATSSFPKFPFEIKIL